MHLAGNACWRSKIISCQPANHCRRESLGGIPHSKAAWVCDGQVVSANLSSGVKYGLQMLLSGLQCCMLLYKLLYGGQAAAIITEEDLALPAWSYAPAKAIPTVACRDML